MRGGGPGSDTHTSPPAAAAGCSFFLKNQRSPALGTGARPNAGPRPPRRSRYTQRAGGRPLPVRGTGMLKGLRSSRRELREGTGPARGPQRRGDPVGPAGGGGGAAPEGLPRGRYLSDGVSEEDDAGPAQEPPAGARLRQRHGRRRTSAGSGGGGRRSRAAPSAAGGGRRGGVTPFRSALKTGFKSPHRGCFMASPRL